MSTAPTMRVLVGFETTTGFATPFQLNNSTYGKLDTGTLGGVQFVDLTSMVRGVSIARGRNRELEQFNAGTASIRFYDPARALDPLNSASPYYPYVGPRNPVAIYANNIQIFAGVVGDWNIDYGFTAAQTTTTASCVDAFTVLASQYMNAWTPGAESSGARVTSVLTRPEVVYQGPVSVDAGSSSLGAFAISEGQNVLQYLQQVTTSEQGYLFIDAQGTLTFRGRSASLSGTAECTFADDGSGIRYQSLTNSFGDELLYNYIQTQSPAGAVQVTSNAASVALYQAQQYSKLDLLNATTSEVASLGNYLLGRYKEPVLRFTGVTTQLAALSASEQNQCLGTDLTDIVAVKKTFPAGTPASTTQYLITTGVSHEIAPGSHIVRFTFESTDASASFTLDSAIFGVLDQNLLAF